MFKRINLASQMMQETEKLTNGSNIRRLLSIFIEGICSYAHKNHQFCFKKKTKKGGNRSLISKVHKYSLSTGASTKMNLF